MNDNIYRFGNVFEINGIKYKFIKRFKGRGAEVEELFFDSGEASSLVLTVNSKKLEDIELSGITPTCLAEMAREKEENIEITFWTNQPNDIYFIASGRGENHFTQKLDESLEELCLRIAIARGYITPEK